MNATNVLTVRMADDVSLVVPASLSSITTYVLLEQERWFEKEASFLAHYLRPGMTAIDIGANLGVYALPMARLVGSAGRVFAYEPAGATRAMLEQSRALNAAHNLKIVDAALSDAEHDGRLQFGASSELHTLGNDGDGERVRITSLDREDATQAWSSPDFIKIDAEGEEERILAGGAGFFGRHSPLVMYEVKADAAARPLAAPFAALGYRLFRLLPGAPILVPYHDGETLDGLELNLFAAKPDRIDTLVERGLLADASPDWQASEADRRDSLEFWTRLGFGGGIAVDPQYREALAGYRVWRDASRPAAIRWQALKVSVTRLRTLCASAPTTERLTTLARMTADAGLRVASVSVLGQVLNLMQRGAVTLREPLLPACPRFDAISAGPAPAEWFGVAVAEQFERSHHFSSFYSRMSPVLAWLASRDMAAAEMQRRHALVLAGAGQRPMVADRLRRDAPDHLNAELWRAGGVPGTVLTA